MSKWIKALYLTTMMAMGIALTASIPVYAEDLSLDQKANVLNQIYVLSGDGTSYNLQGKLKRSEAAAFIVKAVGKQNEVLQKKAQYSKTSFKDVPSAEWFAPYVGYMVEQGFVTGYPDGSFKPNDYVSEKAFYSMLLKAMGYTGSDYDWNGVNKVAFEAGIVTDIMYVFKAEDNTEFKRADVVNALYNAFNSPIKGQTKKFVQLLVDSGMITMDKAESLGFVKIDRKVSAVSQIKVLGSESITVAFNEGIKVPTKDQIKITLKSDATKTLEIRNAWWENAVLYIETAPQADKQLYEINFTSLTDESGNVVDNVKGDFTGFNTPEVVSAFFKISKVEAINTTTVNLYFTHPINEKADVELLYDFYEGDVKKVEGGYKALSVKRNPDKKNVVTISLKEDKFISGLNYQLKVRGDLKSAFGVNLNKGAGDSISFTAATGTILPTTISSVSTESGKYVYVSFSQPVDRESAMKPLNYTIKEKDTGKTMSVLQVYGVKETAQVDKTFVIRTDGLSSSKTYEISANYIYDNYRTGQLQNLKYEFVGSSTVATDEIKLEAVFPLNKHVLIAAFNRELSDKSVNASMAMEGGPIVVMREIDPSNPKFLRLYLNASTPLQSGKTYEVRFFGGVYDFLDKQNTTTLNKTVTGTDTARQDMGIESAQFIDDGVVLVKFNQPIHKTINASLDKYEFSYYEGSVERVLLASSVEVVADDMVLIKLPYLMGNGRYQLRAKYIFEVSGQMSSHILTAEVK